MDTPRPSSLSRSPRTSPLEISIHRPSSIDANQTSYRWAYRDLWRAQHRPKFMHGVNFEGRTWRIAREACDGDGGERRARRRAFARGRWVEERNVTPGNEEGSEGDPLT
eukprot:scaffold911_cov314-Pavlova_lutheri.AAC.1